MKTVHGSLKSAKRTPVQWLAYASFYIIIGFISKLCHTFTVWSILFLQYNLYFFGIDLQSEKIGNFNFENSVSNRNEKIAQTCNFINSRRTDWDHLPYFNEELSLEKIDAFKEERIIKEDEEILILLGLGSTNLIILD